MSERNLRKRKGLYDDSIQSSKKEHVDELQGLINDAKKNAVEEKYVSDAEKLTG